MAETYRDIAQLLVLAAGKPRGEMTMGSVMSENLVTVICELLALHCRMQGEPGGDIFPGLDNFSLSG